MFRQAYWIRGRSILSDDEEREHFERWLPLARDYDVGVLQQKWLEQFEAYKF
jgi:hypothetical protein